MKITDPNLTEIFKKTLAEQLAAEKKFSKFNDKFSHAVFTDELKTAVSKETTNIESHISRLSLAMETVQQKAMSKGSIIDEEVFIELKKMLSSTSSLLKDVEILQYLKLIFNIKVARYDSLYRMAKVLDYPEHALLFEQSSKDNQNTFAYLNQIEQNVIYPEIQKDQIDD